MFGGMGQNGVVFLVLQLRCEQGFLFYYLWILGKSKRIRTVGNLKTVFCLLNMRAFSWLVAGMSHFSLRPVIGHWGTDGRFFKY